MNYCSHCGHHPLRFEIPKGDNRPRHLCDKCHRIHYLNPKIVAGCLALFDNKVLLCKRAIEPRKGYWNLPAGFMENKETVIEAAQREVWEEANAKVDIVQLQSVYNIMHYNQVYFLFLAKLRSEDFRAAQETTEAKLFALDEIPWEQLAFQSNVFALKKYIEVPHFKGVHHGDNRLYMQDKED